MATFLVLIYGNEDLWDAMTNREQKQLAAGHAAFQATATVRGGHELARSSSAVAWRGMTRTDGPFLEPEEVLGGYYLVDAASLDEAASWSALLYEAGAGHSRVEVRAVASP